MLLSSLRSLSQLLAIDGTSVPYLLPASPCDSVSPTGRITITPDENNLTILLINQFLFLLLIIKDRYDGYFVYSTGWGTTSEVHLYLWKYFQRKGDKQQPIAGVSGKQGGVGGRGMVVSIHFSLLPACEPNVSSCLMFPPPCLPAVIDYIP